MLAKSGVGLASAATDSKARKAFGFGKAEPSSPIIHLRPPIRAELRGSDVCTALGLTVRSPSPVLSLCRRLIAAGHDPGRSLHAFRGDVLCLRVASIGQAARLRVAPHGTGFQCVPECTAAPPVRSNGGRHG